MSGSMSGMWKRGTVWIMRHRQTKGPDTDRPDLNNRATSRLYSQLEWQSAAVVLNLPTCDHDLTEAMGINRSSIYAAFGDKESVFNRVMEHYRRLLRSLERFAAAS